MHLCFLPLAIIERNEAASGMDGSPRDSVACFSATLSTREN